MLVRRKELSAQDVDHHRKPRLQNGVQTLMIAAMRTVTYWVATKKQSWIRSDGGRRVFYSWSRHYGNVAIHHLLKTVCHASRMSGSKS